MKTTLFEDANGDEFAVTTHPKLKAVELEILEPGVTVLEIDESISTRVASLVLSTFGENVGVEFHPDGHAHVHAGKGSTRVEMGLPIDADERDEMLNLAITAMGAVNAYDVQVEREREEKAAVDHLLHSLEDLVDGLFNKLQDEEEASEELDMEALALHNAYYGDDLSEPWTLEQLREDDPFDLEAFRRAAQAARTVYAQATTAVAG